MKSPFRIAIYYDAAQPEFSFSILSGVSSQRGETGRHWSFSLHCVDPNAQPCHLNPSAEIDGVIAINISSSTVSQLLACDIPIVSLRVDEAALACEVPHIMPDDTSIGHMGAEYLLECGASRFAFIGDGSSSSIARQHAFDEALALAGLRSSGSFCLRDRLYLHNHLKDENLRDWLTSLSRPVGIFAYDDRHAELLLRACLNLKLQVPNEVKILGVNNESVRCSLPNPTISSINLDYRAWGSRAIAILSKLLRGDSIENRRLRIDPIEVVERRSTEPSAVSDDHVARAIQLIQRQAARGLTVEEIVQKLNISRSNLERRFRKQIGRSPQSELRQTKLAMVKRLLGTTDLPVSEIADMTGFDNPEYLYVAFKRSYRMTPTQYRNHFVGQPSSQAGCTR